jgi:opacity protein-like surface antigen
MNPKDLAKKIASTVAMAGAVPLAAWCGLAMPAAGADFGPPFPSLAAPAPREDLVDFASNWYIRGDLAYSQETFPTDLTSGSSSPVLNTFSAGIGGGYKVNNWFRTDLILDYRSPIHAAGSGAPENCTFQATNPNSPPAVVFLAETCTANFDSEINRWDLLANGYLDLGTWDGFTPYIGAGAGVSWGRTDKSVIYTYNNGLPCGSSCAIGGNIISDFDSNQSSMTYRFAWAAMAGVAIAMTDHVQLDVGYRFLDLGSITGTSSVTGTSVTQRVRANEVRAGLRYMID